jgi:hypothetical protein
LPAAAENQPFTAGDGVCVNGHHDRPFFLDAAVDLFFGFPKRRFTLGLT